MINNQMRTYQYYTLGESDGYGQPAMSLEPAGKIKMAINLLNQNITNNIKYSDSAYVGLTLDKTINDKYIIDYCGEKLKVKYINPIGRYSQVFLGEM